MTRKYIHMCFNKPSTGRNYLGEHKINFEFPVSFLR